MSTPVEITWLLAAVTKGDPVAFERLYGATCAELYGVVLRIVRREDLAADVMEDAYLQIGAAQGSSIPRSRHRLPGWSRSRAAWRSMSRGGRYR